MTNKKIKKLLPELLDGFDWLEERKIYVIKEGKHKQTLLDITFEVSQQTNLNVDSVYQFTHDAIEQLDRYNVDQWEEDAFYQIETDVYTSELLEWLGKSDYHVYYLTEALEEVESDGFTLLQVAQQKAKQDVFTIVLTQLRKL